jgi:hypothetical protein
LYVRKRLRTLFSNQEDASGMSPIITSVITAASGIAGIAGSRFVTAVGEDAYKQLKAVIRRRFAAAEPALLELEATPASEAPRLALADGLTEAGAAGDKELRRTAQDLLAALLALRDQPQPPPLLDFDRLVAAQRFEISDMKAAGTVLRAKDTRFEGEFVFRGVQQSSGEPEKH